MACHDCKTAVEKDFRTFDKLLEPNAWLRMLRPCAVVPDSTARVMVDTELLASCVEAAPPAVRR